MTYNEYTGLQGHTTEENAFIVENYPYGFTQKTNKKYWVETTKRGQRLATQTLNPKTQKWNKPKKSVYYELMVLVINKENNHAEYLTLDFNDSEQKINDFLTAFKPLLNDQQLKTVNKIRAYERGMKHVKITFHGTRYKHKVTGEIKEGAIDIFELNDYEKITQQTHKEQVKIITACANYEHAKMRQNNEVL